LRKSVTSTRPTRASLNRLLSYRNQNPDRIEEIDEEIRAIFQQRKAILALDMCGFSRLTESHGVIHFLAMIQQMRDACVPAVGGNAGRIVKFDADNVFAIFDHPSNALEAALDIFRAFEAMNAVLPDERDLYGSIGIGYGDLLIVGDEDVFGAEMNQASKLGEDIAARMQILLTPHAHDELPPDRYTFTKQSYTAGGVERMGYRLVRPHILHG
jgi:class 3 adenylate cyclase